MLGVPAMAQNRADKKQVLKEKYTPAKKGMPAYYDQNVRKLFKQNKWAEGKKLLDEGMEKYGYLSDLNELMGSYWLHYKQYDKARYYCIRALRDDKGNLQAKQHLVKVEEMTKHYSTAIVYVNELLEAMPYDYTLWRKKIELFRLQGNNPEVSRLLQRLNEIYPERAEVKKEMLWDYEQKYRQYRKKGNIAGQEEMLRRMVELDPTDYEFQMALCNLLIQTGRTEEAIDVAGYAATQVKNPLPFVEKKASILGGMTRYSEALSYIANAEHSLFGVRGRLGKMKSNLEQEAARVAVQNDPYTAYARLYEKEHSEEALTYLLNTAMTRGYLDDALYYIREAKRQRGETENLLLREYTVQRRMGNKKAATALLERIHTKAPNNQEVNEELCAIYMEEISHLMDFNHYIEAIPLLVRLRTFNVDKDTKMGVEQRLLTCYMQTGQRQKALDQLENLGKDEESKAAMYEEIVTPYIKQLMNEGRLHQAEKEILKLLENHRPSADILRMGINVELQLKKTTEATTLVTWGRSMYPDDPYFMLKEAQLKAETGNYEVALEQLRSMLQEYIGDSTVVNAYVECCEALAIKHLKAKQYDEAMRLIDEALLYNPKGKSLILTKTLIYEGRKEWELAISQYRQYHPSADELGEYKRHMEALRRRTLRNSVLVDYQMVRPSVEDRISSTVLISYTRNTKRNAYTFGLAYAGRDGLTKPTSPDESAGGSGVQLSGEWQHEWDGRLTTDATVSVANKIFPRIRVDLKGSYALLYDWTAKGGLSYRLIGNDANTSLVSLGVGADKAINHFSLGATLNLSTMLGGDANYFGSKFYVSANAIAKCFPIEGNRSYIYLTGGVGNAPEVSLIDNSMPVKFNQLNTTFGFGVLYTINSIIDVGLSGQSYSMSVKNSRDEDTNNNKNYLYFNANVTIHF